MAAQMTARNRPAKTPQGRRASLWRKCNQIASEPDILHLLAESLESAGLVGETRNVKLLYLALTSRIMDEIVSVAVKGISSAGKSYVVGEVLSVFPSNAYFDLTSMSEKALIYTEESLSHRHIVLYEAAGVQSDFTDYLIRSLLSENQVKYLTTTEAPKDGKRKARLIAKDGPTGLIVTTTAVKLHAENETRLIEVTVDDSAEQTREVLKRAAMKAEGALSKTSLDTTLWHAFQEWLSLGPCQVIVPYGSILVSMIPPSAVRLRRDVNALFSLVKVHALLHRATRESDHQGRILATIDDYAAVYDLLADVLAQGVEAAVSPTIRETVQTVALLPKGDRRGNGVKLRDIADRLGIDKSSASRRLAIAAERGYVTNLEDRQGYAARYVTNDNLPENADVLPTPEELRRAWKRSQKNR